MKIELTHDELTALMLLRSIGGNVVDIALVAKEAMEAGGKKLKRVRRCITAGAEELRRQEHTESFEKAVEAALEARRGRRIRTIYDFRYVTRRFMKRCPGLSKRKIRSITTHECAQYIDIAFDTPRQRQKARLILSGVFSTAVRRGWCSCNPVTQVEVPRVVEQTVPILSPQEIVQITHTAKTYHHGRCAAAVGMMLYAGIRPHEVARLTWRQVDLQERAIYILPRHSKTGGARRVTIHKPLLSILREYIRSDSEKICPANWLRHWQEVRRRAGWGTPTTPWHQDVLRHTFASYHLSYFRSFTELQVELGHRDTTLLRTRYVDQRGVTNARGFWLEKGAKFTL